MIKTFRGLLADGGQDRIRLSTIKGKVGYKIINFRILSYSPGDANSEHIVKIYSEKQDTLVTGSAKIDFSDPTLMAAAYNKDSASDSSGAYYTPTVIFDNVIVNQDMYVTHTDNVGAVACNYYFELEVTELSDQGAEYTTLKDIRTERQR
jgi:hypothetical protein